MIHADLYVKRINLVRYLPGTDCQECGAPSCDTFVQQLKSGSREVAACRSLTDNQVRAFQIALNADQILPKVPALDLPRPASTGVVEINGADERSPVLISGNSEFTQEVLTGIMAYTLSSFRLLFVDCRGDTVDMAMVYDSLKVEKTIAAVEQTRLAQGGVKLEVFLPGFASRLREPLEQQTEWRVKVGPICVAELPLFLGEKWETITEINLGK